MGFIFSKPVDEQKLKQEQQQQQQQQLPPPLTMDPQQQQQQYPTTHKWIQSNQFHLHWTQQQQQPPATARASAATTTPTTTNSRSIPQNQLWSCNSVGEKQRTDGKRTKRW